MTFVLFSATIATMNSSLQDKKALVIDNSSIITKIIKNFLTQTGFTKSNVFVAHDRNQAMMMFELEKFDLVTSGIHLKDSTGIELLQEIRENSDEEKKSIPFLIVSSENQEIYQQKLDQYPATGYLRKPFNLDQFGTTVHNIFNHKDSAEPVAVKSSESGSTSELLWEESPVEVPASIIEAFTESTIEAMEQYMAEATPENSSGTVELNGYFSAWVDLLNTENRIQITLLLNFPKEAACSIYEGIFGEVEIEQVCGVVQELANIIGGIVKPKIAEFPKDTMQLVYEPQEIPEEDIKLNWDLGLPEAKMGEGHSLDMMFQGVPKFHVPFKIKSETFHLVVLIQKF